MKEQEYKIAMDNLKLRLQREATKTLLRKQLALIGVCNKEIALEVIFLQAKWN
jgi:hypothetical protein